MADKKISELTSITGTDVDDANDTIAIVDSSAGQTKKITREELFKDVAKASFGTTLDLGILNAYSSGVGSTIALFGADLGTNGRNASLQAPETDSTSEPFIWNTGNSWLFRIDATDALLLDSTGSAVFEKDASINGHEIGRGAGDDVDSIRFGNNSLLSADSGLKRNVALGSDSMRATTSGAQNTATGYRTLYSNTTGANNTADGFQALLFNTTGLNNTAVGRQALQDNTTASNNTAVGYQSMLENTTGTNNVAVGLASLYLNTTGSGNVAVGRDALLDLTVGSSNTAVGYGSLENLTTGDYNTGIGRAAGFNVTTGSSNVIIGRSAEALDPTGDDQIVIRAGDTRWYAASGDPEGSVTASVGSMYTRTDGGAGTTLYVKESGTGNTGWVAK